MENASKEKKSTGESSPEHEYMSQEGVPASFLSASDAVFQLQRRYGNSAVQRLLSNPSAFQRVAPGLAAKLQRQERPTRVPHRLEQQAVDINTVGTPQILPRGGFQWLVDFLLPSPAAGDGYIIQECRHNHIDLATGQLIRPEWHYFEAWRVRGGAREPVERGAGNCHDRFGFIIPDTTRPWVETSIRAIAQFYETPQFPWGDTHPLNNPAHNFFVDIPNAPPIWTGAGTVHEAVCTYDARSGTPSSRLVLTHGTQQTVLTDPPSSAP